MGGCGRYAMYSMQVWTRSSHVKSSSYLGMALAQDAASNAIAMLSATQYRWPLHTHSSCAINQPIHGQGCGSLRRRVLSECRVLARLEASPVTRLLGMERERQGPPFSPWFEPTQGLPGWARRARLGRGGKVHFVIRCFKSRLRRPSPTHPPRCWAARKEGCATA